jgi:hypothetical protein
VPAQKHYIMETYNSRPENVSYQYKVFFNEQMVFLKVSIALHTRAETRVAEDSIWK